MTIIDRIVLSASELGLVVAAIPVDAQNDDRIGFDRDGNRDKPSEADDAQPRPQIIAVRSAIWK